MFFRLIAYPTTYILHVLFDWWVRVFEYLCQKYLPITTILLVVYHIHKIQQITPNKLFYVQN